MRLLEGASVFFLLSLLLVSGLFVMGNYQGFLDSSLMLLLRLVSTLSMLCIASGLCYVAALGIWMIRRRHVMVLRFVYGVVATFVGAVVAVAGGALEAFVRSS
ncbi:MAG: hypothetical protein ACOC0Y_00020 [Spirochaetota bacterium]